MPTAKRPSEQVKSSFSPMLAATLACVATSLTIYTDIGPVLDSFLFTEAEAADLATQSKMDSLQTRIDLIDLQLQHVTNDAERLQLTTRRSYYQKQLQYIECIIDPRMDREECIK